MKDREQVQEEAFQALKEHGYSGTCVLSTGTGKSKVAIRCMEEGKFHNVLITSPRTNLKESWTRQLFIWGTKWTRDFANKVIIENIQTVYKWSPKMLRGYDLIIVDECHSIGPEYISYLKIADKLDIPVICLTATPNEEDEFKKSELYKLFPIVYFYTEAEKDSIVNSCRYIIYEYELTDEFKVLVGTKDKKWLVGEKTQYEYLTKQYENGKRLMLLQGAEDYFMQSLQWMKNGTPSQRIAGSTFFRAVKNRKDFLWNLESSASIAINLKKMILSWAETDWRDEGGIKLSLKLLPGEKSTNKVLLFSELTQQANRLSKNLVHSNVTSKASDTALSNKFTLDMFNQGKLRDIASCNSLTLGLNLVGANWAIFESYSSSNVNSVQKAGRLHRLGLDEVANIIIIKPKNTQMEVWFDKAFDFVENFEVITNVNELRI